MNRSEFLSLTPYERHRRMLEDYAKYYGRGRPASEPVIIKSDADALKSSFRFIRTDEDDAEGTWEQRLARKYYDKLFKEYAICDMSRYKEQKLGMRWRTEKEVVVGKGQFICGGKRCENKDDLVSYEVNFAYVEGAEEKNALVKLRVCPECAYKLNYGRSVQLSKAGVKSAQKARRKRRREAEGLGEEDAKERRRRKKEATAKRGDAGPAGGASDDEEQSDEARGSREGGAAAEGEIPVEDERAFWRGEKKEEKEPTREEEHDAYFAGLFM